MWDVCAIPRQDRYSLRSEVPTRVAILYESARQNRHKVVDDLPHSGDAIESGWDPFL